MRAIKRAAQRVVRLVIFILGIVKSFVPVGPVGIVVVVGRPVG